MSATTEKARELLSSRLTELNDETKRVEGAIAALSPNGKGPRKRGPGRPKERRTRRAVAPAPSRPSN